MPDSLWFTTESALFRPGDEAWSAVAAYAGPLRRLLERRYGWLPEADREDLASEVLIEIKESLAAGHDRSRGRFRALLQAVVRRRVADRLRGRRRTGALGPAEEASLAAPEEAEVAALDLEAALLEAVSACRDRFTQGRTRDPDVLYALAGRIVHGRSNAEIAARSGAIGRERRSGRAAPRARARRDLPRAPPARARGRGGRGPRRRGRRVQGGPPETQGDGPDPRGGARRRRARAACGLPRALPRGAPALHGRPDGARGGVAARARADPRRGAPVSARLALRARSASRPAVAPFRSSAGR